MATSGGEKELQNGLNSKLKEIAPASLETNSKINPIATPKKIFLPRVMSLADPKIKSIANKIIAIRDSGLSNLL